MEAPTWHMSGRMTAAPYEHAQGMGSEQLEHKASQSSEEEWKQILERVNAGEDDNSNDFTIMCPPPTQISAFDPSPRQSIETSTAMDIEPQLSNSSSNSSLYPYVPLEAVHEEWPATSAPTLSFPPAIPEHETWSAHSNIYTPPIPTGLPAHLHMHENQFYYRHGVLNTSPLMSPMLSQGSPHDPDYVEEGWGQQEAQQQWQTSSGCEDVEDDMVEVCYAQLLWRCLKEAPEHTMSLKELYEWVKEHSLKAKDPKNKGWQNSVRHNLSMNAAFERVTPRDAQGVKKASLWRLTSAALRDGVISTTRYRKDPKHKPIRKGAPAIKRQISGAKGGQATRASQRRAQQLREARSHPDLSSRHRHDLRHDQRYSPGLTSPLPFFGHHPMPHPFLPTPRSPYFHDVDESMSPMPRSGPLTPPRVHMMYEAHPKPIVTDFSFGHLDFTNGGMITTHHEDFTPDTPSLATEASFMSEDGMQSLMSHNASREHTSFPVADV